MDKNSLPYTRTARSLLSVLTDLLKIDAPPKEERPVADYLITLFKKIGIALEEDKTGTKINGNSGNLYTKIKGTKKRDSIALLAHMDTVSSTKGQNPIIKNSKICSNGKTVLGGDNRAGIALIYALIKHLQENKIEHGPIEIIFTVAEEIGLLGAKNLNFKKLDSKTAFVLDAGGPSGTIISAAPGIEKISISVKGKSAHAGMAPEKGINAIAIAAKAISSLKQGRIDKDTTLNIGKINGGQATNIVPEKVHIEAEIRSFNNNALKNQLDIVSQKFKKAADGLGGKINFNHELWCSSFDLGKNTIPVNLSVKAARKLGINYKVTFSGGGSDANVLNKENITSIGLAIGMYNAHTKDEYILLEDLYNSFQWLIEIVKLIPAV